MHSWTDVGVFLCNVVEGLGFAVILLVIGALAIGRSPSDDQ